MAENNDALGATGAQEGPNIVLGFVDIVRQEAHDPNRDKSRMPLLPNRKSGFELSVAYNLWRDIEELKKDPNTKGKKLLNMLLNRYHPDRYAQEDEATRELANEYAKCVSEYYQIGHLETDIVPRPPQPRTAEVIVITQEDIDGASRGGRFRPTDWQVI